MSVVDCTAYPGLSDLSDFARDDSVMNRRQYFGDLTKFYWIIIYYNLRLRTTSRSSTMPMARYNALIFEFPPFADGPTRSKRTQALLARWNCIELLLSPMGTRGQPGFPGSAWKSPTIFLMACGPETKAHGSDPYLQCVARTRTVFHSYQVLDLAVFASSPIPLCLSTFHLTSGILSSTTGTTTRKPSRSVL